MAQPRPGSTREPRDLGQAFEGENERADIERWRSVSDAERGRAIIELLIYAESVAAATGVRNDEPAPVLPRPRGSAADGN